MPEKVLMIALSPTMETGTVARWRKKEGDKVASGDVLCEVETDKATMDYESSAEGTLLKIVLPEGGQAKVGDLIAIVGKPGDDISALLAEGGGAAAPKAAGAKPASSAQAAASRAPAAPAPGAATVTAAALAAPGARVRSSPLARKLAQQKGIDLRSVRGTGPGGRVVRRDLDGLAAGAAAPAGAGTTARAAAPVLQTGPGDQVIPVSGMRKVIAKRLSDSMYTSPHYYLTVAVGMDELLAARSRLNGGRDRKISVNAFLMGIAARALERHPRVNSTWNTENILQHPTADIGLAVALPDGLITPLVRDCGHKGIAAIDMELAELIEKARAGKLAPQDYTGATFTISNLGAMGIDEFTAIINPPGSAILAVGAVRKEPVVENDTVVIRQRMRITLSCDHRIIDGAMGAAFLRELADMLENPLLALA
ncbi:MAG TPA: pyruvate dehydrogenase complex dihydrolipoamide acetyltransferase [Spirochaetia bacterium]|nr:pyruvate dehydrogenase complex dihydrolipoamide acetyltransferase [Spirochaetia bacterium]